MLFEDLTVREHLIFFGMLSGTLLLLLGERSILVLAALTLLERSCNDGNTLSRQTAVCSLDLNPLPPPFEKPGDPRVCISAYLPDAVVTG